MSGLSVICTRLYHASELLTPYVLLLESLRTREGLREPRPDETKSILDILAPLCLYFKGINHYNLGINGEKMSKFLHARHHDNWPRVREDLLSVTARLEKGDDMSLSDEDMAALNDVSDALDYVCGCLYREISRK